jgi:hypothetical protein
VGFGAGSSWDETGDDAVKVANYVYHRDPYTNEITGWTDLTGNLFGKQLYVEEKVIEERARELAFEGERFYDLIRVAKRRGDPSYLAKIVAGKFPEGRREEIESLLMNEENWYVQYYE